MSRVNLDKLDSDLTKLKIEAKQLGVPRSVTDDIDDLINKLIIIEVARGNK